MQTPGPLDVMFDIPAPPLGPIEIALVGLWLLTLYYLFQGAVSLFKEIPRWVEENRAALRFWANLSRWRDAAEPELGCVVTVLRVIVGAIWTIVSGVISALIVKHLFGM